MIKISRLAAIALLEDLQSYHVNKDMGLRLTRMNGRFKLDIDIPKPNDRVVEVDGSIVLMIDRAVELGMGDVFIDIEESTTGNRLVIRQDSVALSQ